MNSKITKIKILILFFTITYLLIFTYLYWGRENYEFLMYIGAVFLVLTLISIINFKFEFSNFVLIGMSLWGLMHMSGGYFIINNSVLYGYWLLPFLKFDQFVHAFGFGFATLFSYEILKKYFNKLNLAISIFLVFIGMGIGALNEIIEFIAVVLIPQTGVGGYENTMLDIIFNTIGAVIAVIWLNIKKQHTKVFLIF